MTRILVTGASGTVGTPLVAELDTLGADVLALHSHGTPDRGTRVASFDDRASLERAFDGVDVVLLQFPLAPDMPAMARNAVAAARSAGVRHLVRIGVLHAAADSRYALLRAHGAVDDIVMRSGIPWTLLQACAFMQNWVTRFGAQVRSGTVPSLAGAAPRAWVDARDVAAAAARVLTDPAPYASRVLSITGPESLTDEAFAGVVGEAIGRPVRIRPSTPDDAIAEMAGLGIEPWLAMLRDSMNRALAEGRLATKVDPVAAELILRPRIDARTFARDYAPAWGARGR